MKQLNIAPAGLGGLLANRRMSVPIYQRSYAWKELHVTKLLTDLNRAINRAPPQQGVPAPYFLGSIVVIQRPSGGRLEIVDGQQRLATASILITAIRDTLLELEDEELAKQYEQRYLRYLETSPVREWINQLVLNEVDDDCFAKCIIARPRDREPRKNWTRPWHRKIFAAYQTALNYVRTIVATYGKRDAPAQLARWVDYLRDNAQVVVVTVEDNADAFEIFETLNDRGLALSIADLLKNFLFGESGEHLDTLRANWGDMMGALQTLGKKDRTVDFIRQLWGSMHGIIRGHDLFSDMREKTRGREDVKRLGRQFAEGAASYAAILNPDHDMWDAYGAAARNSLIALRTLRLERVRPLLLSVVKRFSVPEVTKTLKYLEGAAVRITIGSTAAGTIEEEFMKCAKEIYDGTIKNTAGVAAKLTVVPSNARFLSDFRLLRVSNHKLARYYLLKLDAVDDPDQDRILNPDEKKLDLEHILPENDWSAWLSQDLSEEKAKDLCRRLGNLALCRCKINNSMQAQTYQEKATRLSAQGSIRLTCNIPAKWPPPTWGEQQINERQDQLAQLALRAWPIAVE